jgi:hypothetical protein
MNEGAFEVPGTSVTDRTTHVVNARRGDHDLSLVVVRLPVPQGRSLRQLAQGRVLDEMARLSGYSVLEERESEGEAAWDGLPALEVASRWRHDGKAVYQKQAHLALSGTWIYFALSTLFEGRAEADAWFDQIRSTLRLRSVD